MITSTCWISDLPVKDLATAARSAAFCRAEGELDRWEAYCLTFDLAVRGSSFIEVRQKLHDQIALYLEGVAAAPESERGRLRRRSAPWWRWPRRRAE